MRCGFCGKEISEETGPREKACGACPGGCRKVHCPHCGYGNPAITGFLKRRKEADKGKDAAE
jgi:hypothetical protein